MDLADGEKYTLLEKNDKGVMVPITSERVPEMKAPHRLVTTFVIQLFNGSETTVTWQLDEMADGTRLTLTHDGVEEAEGGAISIFMSLVCGWDENFARL